MVKTAVKMHPQDSFSIGTISDQKKRGDCGSQFSKQYSNVHSKIKRSLERDNSFLLSSNDGSISKYNRKYIAVSKITKQESQKSAS